jgi:hypothetical protein
LIIKRKIAAAAVTFAVTAGGLGMAAATAGASSFDCVAGAGCATLQGVNASGHHIALDAKNQSATGIDIGYPDLKQDRATSFDKVEHIVRSGSLKGKTVYSFVYAPDGDWSNTCVTRLHDGKLAQETCTNGHDPAQLFAAATFTETSHTGNTETGTLAGPVEIPNYTNAAYVLLNVAALPTSAPTPNQGVYTQSSGLLEDTDHSNPATPQPTAGDSRQLDVNGSATYTGASGSGSYDLTGVTVHDNELWRWHT